MRDTVVAAAEIETWQADHMSRDPETIQREIVQTREALAGTLDELAERTSPKRLAAIARERAIEVATSPPGMAAIGAVGLLTLLLITRRVRGTRATRRTAAAASGH
jgi:Protein of unknown function (DUF3618)